MREQILSRRFTLTGVTALAGVEVANVIGAIGSVKGYIEQVVVRATSGGGTDVEVQVRYVSGVANEEDLAYKFTGGVYPLIDSAVNGPFDSSPYASNDIILFVKPQADGDLEVRVDFRIVG